MRQLLPGVPMEARVQREVEGMRGTPPAELESIRKAAANKIRLHIETLSELRDDPEATAHTQEYIDTLTARVTAIDKLLGPSVEQTTFGVAPVLMPYATASSRPAPSNRPGAALWIAGGLVVVALILVSRR